jgi:hypothetical protein
VSRLTSLLNRRRECYRRAFLAFLACLLLSSSRFFQRTSMPEPSTIYDYRRCHAALLGERILEEYPALQQFDDAVSHRIEELLRTSFPAQTIAIMGWRNAGGWRGPPWCRRMRHREDPDLAGCHSCPRWRKSVRRTSHGLVVSGPNTIGPRMPGKPSGS